MSLAAYRLVATIAEQKNLTKAAELLNITPSAASHALNALENICGFSIFTRNRNGSVLTKNGELLLPRIRAILSENERLQEEIAQIHGVEKGTVHVGVFNSVCKNWLPGIMQLFKTQNPQIEVHIYQESYRVIEEMLMDGVLDVGFVSLPTLEKFTTITLLHDRLLCITPVDFVPSNQNYITAEELVEQTMFFSTRGLDRVTREFLRANGLKESPNHHITLESSVVALVESGFGCSILAELIIQGNPGRYNTYPLSEGLHRTIALATTKNQKPSPACQKMIQVIQSYIQTKGFQKKLEQPMP